MGLKGRLGWWFMAASIFAALMIWLRCLGPVSGSGAFFVGHELVPGLAMAGPSWDPALPNLTRSGCHQAANGWNAWGNAFVTMWFTDRRIGRRVAVEMGGKFPDDT